MHAPISTYEKGIPDPLKPTDPTPSRPELWQVLPAYNIRLSFIRSYLFFCSKTVAGTTWDRVQHRDTNFHRQAVS